MLKSLDGQPVSTEQRRVTSKHRLTDILFAFFRLEKLRLSFDSLTQAISEEKKSSYRVTKLSVWQPDRTDQTKCRLNITRLS